HLHRSRFRSIRRTGRAEVLRRGDAGHDEAAHLGVGAGGAGLRRAALTAMLKWLLVMLLAGSFGWLAFAANAAPLALDIEGDIANTNDPEHTVYHLTEAD